jgi:hydroxyethylthiazole kinase-like uncharacterized protein yjeF
MGSLTCQEMRKLEEQAFRQGATAEGLMEKAGQGIAAAIMRRYSPPGKVIACIGSGNNGGDALVALRHLAAAGWLIGVRCLHTPSQVAALPRNKWRELDDCPWSDELDIEQAESSLILLDGLLGIGAAGPLRSPLDQLAAWMNTMRLKQGADIIAMDIPSGLNGDTGEIYDGAVVADHTLTVGVPKAGLLSPSAADVTGSIETVQLAELPVPDDDSPCLIDAAALRGVLPRRPHDYHKGQAGRVGIFAGSEGMLGAAVLCAKGAIRSGAGLVTLFAYEEIYPLLALMLPPEVMLRRIKTLSEIGNVQLDVLAMGPGMGSGNQQENRRWLQFLRQLDIPLVLDADALNRLAGKSLMKYLRPNHVLTPHPGEMARLFPEAEHMTRWDKVHAFTERYPGTTLLLKGSHSMVAQSDHPACINGSGHAGMACGGQGDVLTGVIAGLMAQGLSGFDSARLGAWLCGRAAELAVSHGDQSMPSLSASDIPTWLGRAFREIA